MALAWLMAAWHGENQPSLSRIAAGKTALIGAGKMNENNENQALWRGALR